MLLWSALHFEGKISSCLYSISSIILVQCLLRFPGMIIKVVPLQALLHNVHAREIRQHSSCAIYKTGLCNPLSTCYKIYFHFFHVPLNLFDRISEGKMCLPEGRSFLLLGVRKDAESFPTLFAII